MPNYNVLKPGFRHGRLYDPQGKRSVLVENEPFTDDNPKPSWVGDVVESNKIADEIDSSVEATQEAELKAHDLAVAEEEALSEEAQRLAASSETQGVSPGGVVAEVSLDVTESEQATSDKPKNSNTEVLG